MFIFPPQVMATGAPSSAAASSRERRRRQAALNQEGKGNLCFIPPDERLRGWCKNGDTAGKVSQTLVVNGVVTRPLPVSNAPLRGVFSPDAAFVRKTPVESGKPLSPVGISHPFTRRVFPNICPCLGVTRGKYFGLNGYLFGVSFQPRTAPRGKSWENNSEQPFFCKF